MNAKQQLKNIYIPFCYLIGWSTYNKFYYGVRYAKNCTPADLWKSYFTSSKLVKKYILLYGNPDIIQVRKTFKCAYSAIAWEQKVLKKMNVLNDSRFLNKNIAGAILPNKCVSYGMLGKHLSDQAKEKIRQKAIGRKHTEKTRRKLSEIKTGKSIKMSKPRALQHTINQAEATKKQIKIKLNEQEWIFNSRLELIQQFGMRLKDLFFSMNNNIYIIKKISKRTKHPFKVGDKLQIIY